MNCEYPLQFETDNKQKGKDSGGVNSKKLKATYGAAPFSLPMPQLSLNKQEELVLKAGKIPRPSLKIQKEQHTYPVPLFKPFVAQCGHGMHYFLNSK